MLDELNKIYMSCIISEQLLPIVEELNTNILNTDNLYFINNNLKQEHIILEDVYKKSIFETLITNINQSKSIIQYSFDKMKYFLKNKLKPIKNKLRNNYY